MTTQAFTDNPYAEPMSPAQILFSFNGRIPRKTYWLWGVLALLGAAAGISMLLRIAGVGETTTEMLVQLLVVWPAVAVSVKRWHDRNKSGWWVLINLIPVVGALWTLVENGFLRGTPGPNRFGDDLTGRI